MLFERLCIVRAGARTGGVAAVLAALVLLAGCGGSSSNGEAKKSAADVVNDTRAAALAAGGVHVTGTIKDNGTLLTLDLQITNGHGGKGSMSENGLEFDLVRVGTKAYIKGSNAFLKKFAGAAAPLLSGKWLVGRADTGQLASLVPLTDITQLLKAVLGSHGALANRGETTYKGQKVVAIADTTQGGTLYVAATGKPYPVALVGGRSNSGSVTFTDWGSAVDVVAPKGAIDISKLSSG